MASFDDRLRFPDDRTTFVYQGAFQPILTPPITSVTIYTDEAGTIVADILDPSGNPIVNATVQTDATGMIPEFYGPGGNVARLYARTVGTTGITQPLDAQYSGQLALLPTILSGHGAPTATNVALESLYLDVDSSTLYGPYSAQGWGTGQALVGPQGTPGTPGASGGAIVFQQSMAVTEINVPHTFGRLPTVEVYDTTGEQVFANVMATTSLVTVTTSAPFAGTVVLN